jgi:hypothetical protein
MRSSRFLRIAAPFAAALATVALMAAVADAHHTDRLDLNDTAGKLDVKRVRFTHASTPPLWTIVTFAEWGTGEIWDHGYLMVMLDTAAGASAEHYALVRSTGSSLVGSLWRARNVGSDTFLGSLTVKRHSRWSASIQVPLYRLTFGEDRWFYRWWVETLFTGSTCTRSCQDRAPNGNPVLQWRPGMSPSPSPTPSPTPSPSGSPSP